MRVAECGHGLLALAIVEILIVIVIPCTVAHVAQRFVEGISGDESKPALSRTLA